MEHFVSLLWTYRAAGVAEQDVAGGACEKAVGVERC